jgi:choline dehydrogenase-like flavoprotein
MADEDIDVVIVGSGFAGSLIANELAKQGKKIVILEAGDGVPSNINGYMERFYKAEDKVPESPYPPSMSDKDGHFDASNPKNMHAGRPTVRTLGPGAWNDPRQSYLDQSEAKRPFASTYNRVAGGTSHWLGTCLRFVPSDFRMKTLYGKSVPEFVDWPICYDDLVEWYGKAEAEIGVSADVADQGYLNIYFPSDYNYPMPPIPRSPTDRAIGDALATLDPAQTAFLGMATAPETIKVRPMPAARNSQPYRNRRACAGNTNCIPICPIQAKYDPTISLNEALNHKNVRLMRHTVAREIVLDADLRNVSEIKYTRYSATSNEALTDTIKAKIFVIAANAIETPRLLLMSTNDGRTPDGVANFTGMVGKYLMDHPYYVAWGQLPLDGKQQLWPYRGPLITSGIGDLCDGPFRSQRGAFRVDIGNEGWNFVAAGVVGPDPHATTIDFVNGVNRSLSRQPDRNRVGFFGPALTKALNDNITRQFRIGFLVEQTPDAGNRVTLSDHVDGLDLRRPKIAYDLSPYTRRGIAAAYKMKNLIFQKMNAIDYTDRVVMPNDPTRFEQDVDGKSVTLNYGGAGHIMGTCRMGFDQNDSVVDSFQRSHDHDNLYLVGSSTFPTGATANPTLTIAALALRTADRIAQRV